MIRSNPQVDDLGFARPEAARHFRQLKAAAAAELHGALIPVVISRLTTLQDLINQSAQRKGDEGPVSATGGGLLTDYRKGIIAYRAIERIGCDDLGEHELLQCIDAVLQFLELALIGRGHSGESPDVVGPDLPTPTPSTPHCLSETPE